MNTKITSLIVLACGLAAVSARAQTTPLLVANIVEIDVTNNTVGGVDILTSGSGYNNVPPTVVFNGGGGTGAGGTANLDSSNNAVISVTMGPPGSKYITPPVVTFVGGGLTGPGSTAPTEATGQAFLTVLPGNIFLIPKQNEAFGPAGDTISIDAVATGTDPAAGFIFQFTVNGQSIGETSIAVSDGQKAGVYWTPALPGVYSIVTMTSDGNGNSAISQPIRYFAEGTVIVAPEAGGTVSLGAPGPGSLVPVGSTVYLQATSTAGDGFVQRIDFYTDWTGSTGGSTLIGSVTHYPYTLQYKPSGSAGATHLIKAIGYDNLGVIIPNSVANPIPNQDEILLTMTTPNPGGLPTGTIISPATGSLIEIPDYTADASAYIPILVTAGAQTGAQIIRVEFYVNGVLNGTDTSYDNGYNFKWSPATPGAYALSALIYDNLGNVVPSTSITANSTVPVGGPDNVIIEAVPAIAITNPSGGATIGTLGATVQAVAVDTNLDLSGNPIPITTVQFFQDGVQVGQGKNSNGDSWVLSFSPKQKIVNGQAVQSALTAIATDADGFSGTSLPVNVNVTAGGTSTNNVVIGIPPVVTLTSPAANAQVVVNIPTTLTATASASNGNVVEADFFVDGTKIAGVTQYPYSASWTPRNPGTYLLQVSVTDNVGDVTLYPAANATQYAEGIPVTVVAPLGPTISFTSPSAGSTVSAGGAVTLTANAASPSGTIAQVQFFANGISIGTVSSAPYTVSFTPPSSGVYTLTAIATDNSGIQTTSTAVVVEAIPTTSGVGTTEFFGQYQGLTDTGGRFAFITVDGKFGTYIGHSLSTPSVTTIYTDLPVSSSGNFTSKNVTGNASAAGVNGTLSPSQDLFIGAAVPSGGAAAGYFTGSISGVAGSQVIAIVGGDGSLMAYISTGSTTDVADGSIDSDGKFAITTVNNNSFNGSIDLNKAFLNATFSGAGGGAITGGKVSGGVFSDGVLKNISTRGQVGTGNNIMVAGFAVGGTTPKSLLIRAVGPTLSTFGLSGSIPSTVLQIYSGTTLVQSNTGWSSTPANTTAITAADSQVGAFALPTGSADSALIGTFAPGTYTAQISGVGGATGLALAEVYDLDTYVPFSAQRLVNVSTRGQVGAGSSVLIGGFSIDGTAPKRLLIRGAGPTLSTFSVTGSLSAAHLQLMDSNQKLIRENFSWQNGNDSGIVTAAETATGAFAFTAGSNDAAILITLPPGTYTAILSGATSTATGVGLVEVYEVP